MEKFLAFLSFCWDLLKMAFTNPRKAISTAFEQRWIRFGLVGVAATLCYFILGIIFVYGMSMPVLYGNALAYVLSFAVSYLGQSKWTFQASGSHLKMLPRFAAVQVMGLGLNSLLVDFLVRTGLPYALDMFIAAALVPIAVYLLCKIWVFKNRATQEKI